MKACLMRYDTSLWSLGYGQQFGFTHRTMIHPFREKKEPNVCQTSRNEAKCSVLPPTVVPTVVTCGNFGCKSSDGLDNDQCNGNIGRLTVEAYVVIHICRQSHQIFH